MCDEMIKTMKSIDGNLSWIALWLFFITIGSCGVQTVKIQKEIPRVVSYGDSNVVVQACQKFDDWMTGKKDDGSSK